MTDAADTQAKAVVATAVSETLHRQDVPIEAKDVSAATVKTTAAVMDAINRSDAVAVVPVESPWTSKINITQAITALIALLVAFGIPISDEQKVSVLTIVGVFGPFVTGILKTFFTKGIASTSR